MLKPNLHGNERGSAMVIALMALVLMTMVGTFFLAQTKTETQIAGHEMRGTQAFFNAEAGLSEMLGRMSDTQDSTNYIGEPLGQATPGWGRYIVLSDGRASEDPDYSATQLDSLDNDGDGVIDEDGERYPQILTVQDPNSAIEYPWVKVRYMMNTTNQVLLFGDADRDLTTPPTFNLLDGYPVIIVTAEGGKGSAVRRVEVEAIKRPFQIVHTPYYTESTSFTFNGTQFSMSGEDYDPATGLPISGNPDVPGITMTQDPSNATSELTSQQVNNIEGTGGSPSITQSSVDLDLDAIAGQFMDIVDITVPPGTYDDVAWGSYDDYKVVHVTGDLHTSGGVSGGGVLIVDGNLDMSGSFTWYGLVIVMGDVKLTGGGAGIHIYGGLYANGTTTISGNADLRYSSEALNRLYNFGAYQILNWREIS